MDNIKVGDRVRSYDFDGRRDCFIEGEVKAVGPVANFADCDRYSILVDRVVFAGAEDKHCMLLGDIVYPPVNGTPKFNGEVCVFVERV